MRLALTPEAYAALRQRRLRVALLIEMEFALTTMRWWTRRGILTWQGVPWYGSVGSSSARGSVMVNMTRVQETNEVKSVNVGFKLNGVPIEVDGRNLLRMVTEYVQQGKSARLWFALFNLNTDALIIDPSQFFAGQLDVPIIEPSLNEFSVTINTASRLDILQGHCGLRYNLESHQRDHPGDLGFEFTNRSIHQPDNFG